MLPFLNLKWTCFDDVLDGQWVGIHEVWEPNPKFWDMLLVFKTMAPKPPFDTLYGTWLVTPIMVYDMMPPLPSRFLTGEATRCIFDERPFWRVADRMVPCTAGPIEFLVVTINENIYS